MSEEVKDATDTAQSECNGLLVLDVGCEICRPTHEHIFDGKAWYSEDGRTGSVTCSLCGLPEIFWDQARN